MGKHLNTNFSKFNESVNEELDQSQQHNTILILFEYEDLNDSEDIRVLKSLDIDTSMFARIFNIDEEDLYNGDYIKSDVGDILDSAGRAKIEKFRLHLQYITTEPYNLILDIANDVYRTEDGKVVPPIHYNLITGFELKQLNSALKDVKPIESDSISKANSYIVSDERVIELTKSKLNCITSSSILHNYFAETDQTILFATSKQYNNTPVYILYTFNSPGLDKDGYAFMIVTLENEYIEGEVENFAVDKELTGDANLIVRDNIHEALNLILPAINSL